MFVQMTIYRSKPGKEAFLLDSMHRFQDAISARPGFRSGVTFKDRKTGRFIGIATWDIMESMLITRPAKIESTKNDRFDEWVETEENFQLDEV